MSLLVFLSLYVNIKFRTLFLIKKRESTGLKPLNDSKDFIDYSNNMNDIYKNFEDYNLNKWRKILIVFGDMIFDMLYNKCIAKPYSFLVIGTTLALNNPSIFRKCCKN